MQYAADQNSTRLAPSTITAYKDNVQNNKIASQVRKAMPNSSYHISKEKYIVLLSHSWIEVAGFQMPIVVHDKIWFMGAKIITEDR